jgi:hypothetical protein
MIGRPSVRRIRIGRRKDSEAFVAQPTAGADRSQRDFAAIGDQHSLHRSPLSCSVHLAGEQHNCRTG